MHHAEARSRSSGHVRNDARASGGGDARRLGYVLFAYVAVSSGKFFNLTL